MCSHTVLISVPATYQHVFALGLCTWFPLLTPDLYKAGFFSVFKSQHIQVSSFPSNSQWQLPCQPFSMTFSCLFLKITYHYYLIYSILSIYLNVNSIKADILSVLLTTKSYYMKRVWQIEGTQ